MTDEAVECYLDKYKLIRVTVNRLSTNNLMTSIYNNRNDSSVWFTGSREELKGLADFIYQTIGEKNESY
jgi:hypothetical protein